MKRVVGSLGIFLISHCSCGSDEVVLGCDIMTGGQHRCEDYRYAASGEDLQTPLKNMCTGALAGTVVTQCYRMGSVGGCRVSNTLNNVTGTVTVWYYAGTPSVIMQSCGSGTFVTP